MPRLLERPEPSPTIADSSQQRARLSLGSMMAGYKIRFTGTLTVSGLAMASLNEDAPLGYLRSIDLVLGGSFPLRVHDARFLNFWNRFTRMTANRLTQPATTVGSSAFVAETIVDLADPSLLYGLARAFYLDSRPMSALELAFTYGLSTASSGAQSDIGTSGATGTHASSALAIQITGMQVPDLKGILSRQQFSFVQQAITGTGNLDLPPFSGLGINYRAFALHFTSGNADPLRATSDDTILTDITLMDSRGVRYYDAVPYEQIRAENKRTRGLESLANGWCVLDFAPNEDLEDVLIAESQNLTMRLNVGAAPANSFVRVYPIVLLKRRAR